MNRAVIEAIWLLYCCAVSIVLDFLIALNSDANASKIVVNLCLDLLLNELRIRKELIWTGRDPFEPHRCFIHGRWPNATRQLLSLVPLRAQSSKNFPQDDDNFRRSHWLFIEFETVPHLGHSTAVFSCSLSLSLRQVNGIEVQWIKLWIAIQYDTLIISLLHKRW